MRSNVGPAECTTFDIDFGGKYEGVENKNIFERFQASIVG
jgi:hypothetical protein